jgi:hypothetical protein
MARQIDGADIYKIRVDLDRIADCLERAFPKSKLEAIKDRLGLGKADGDLKSTGQQMG